MEVMVHGRMICGETTGSPGWKECQWLICCMDSITLFGLVLRLDRIMRLWQDYLCGGEVYLLSSPPRIYPLTTLFTENFKTNIKIDFAAAQVRVFALFQRALRP